MSTPPLLARVTDEPLSVADHEAAVNDKAAGAVVSFAGVVRDHDGGRSVTELEYVGHPTAGDLIAEIAAEFAARPDVQVAERHQLELGVGAGHVPHRHGLPRSDASTATPEQPRPCAGVESPLLCHVAGGRRKDARGTPRAPLTDTRPTPRRRR